MSIHEAKEIAIADILDRLGIVPSKTSGNKRLYLSPIRQEKTPSFYLYLNTNRWHDFGDGRGGDAVDFAKAYLKFTREADTTFDALRWLKNMGAAPVSFRSVLQAPAATDDAALTLRKASPIQQLGLIRYLAKRGVSPPSAASCLKEIHVRNQRSGKSFFALGLLNEEDGYELRNPFFKGTLGTKAISFIRGSEPTSASLHLFEGLFDYLSVLSGQQASGFKGDVIILNSLSCLKQISPYVQGYGYRVAHTWLDNDPAGSAATATLAEFFATQVDLVHRPMNHLYAPHKDVNAWHMHRLGLSR